MGRDSYFNSVIDFIFVSNTPFFIVNSFQRYRPYISNPIILGADTNGITAFQNAFDKKIKPAGETRDTLSPAG